MFEVEVLPVIQLRGFLHLYLLLAFMYYISAACASSQLAAVCEQGAV